MRSVGFAGSMAQGMFSDYNTKCVDVHDLETPPVPGAYDNVRFPLNGLGMPDNASSIIGMGALGITGWTEDKDLDDRLRRYSDYLKQRIGFINTHLPIPMRQSIARQMPADPSNPIDTRPHVIGQANSLLAVRTNREPWFPGGSDRRVNRLRDVKEGYLRLEDILQKEAAGKFDVPSIVPAPSFAEVLASPVKDFNFASAPSYIDTVVEVKTQEIVKTEIPWLPIILGVLAVGGIAFAIGGLKKTKS